MTQNIDHENIPEITLGWRIQMALAYAGLKQTDLMDYFELSRGTISRWCRDEGAPPKRHQVQQIALMTGVPFEWLQTGRVPAGNGPDGGDKRLGGDDECPQSGSNRRPADYKSGVLTFPTVVPATERETKQGEAA